MSDNDFDTALRRFVRGRGDDATAPSDEMWMRIRRQRTAQEGSRRSWLIACAAAGIVCVALRLGGRAVSSRHAEERREAVVRASASRVLQRHLAQSDTVIAAFDREVAAGSLDDHLLAWARDLDLATRELQASSVVRDAPIANLLVDLDFVLTQIANCADVGRNRAEESALAEFSIRERAVIPRLRAASVAVIEPTAQEHDSAAPSSATILSTSAAQDGHSLDSIFRAAREALANRDYEAAAQLFARVAAEFPDSTRVADALYWRGYALYVSGVDAHDVAALNSALGSLDDELRRPAVAQTPAGYLADQARELRARVLSGAANLGDPHAVRALASASRALGGALSCGDTDLDLDLAVLERRVDQEGEAAIPAIQRALATEGTCADAVRRAVVTAIANTAHFDITSLMMSVVRTNWDVNVRMQAVDALGAIGSNATTAFLDSLVSADHDTFLRHQVVLALSLSANPAAVAALERIAAGGGAIPPDIQAEASRRIHPNEAPAAHLEQSARQQPARSSNSRTEPPVPDSGVVPVPLHGSLKTVVSAAALRGVDVASILVDADGSLLVADKNQKTILVFDSSGRRTGAIGQLGPGRGTLAGVDHMGWLGDTLVVDEQGRSLQFFTRGGAWLATTPWRNTGSIDQLFSAGGRLFAEGLMRSGPPIASLTGGMFVPPRPGYFEIRGPGAVRPMPNLVDTFPVPVGMDCKDAVAGVIHIVDTSPFGDRGPVRAFTARGDLIVGSAVRLSLGSIRPGSGGQQLMDRAYRQWPVTDSVWARANASVDTIAHDPGIPLVCEPADQRPAFQPVVRTVLTDDRGRLWLELTAEHGFTLDVVSLPSLAVGPDHEGRNLGPGASAARIAEGPMPERDPSVTPVVRGDRMYVVAIDATGAQSIAVYSIQWPWP
jgi:hypothetical protein